MPESTASQRSWRRVLLRGCFLGLSVALATEAYRVFLGDNFHILIPGKVFRSAQLTGAELERVVRAHGIRTVVNLRGSCDPNAWYVEECRATQRLDINQEDICFSSGRLPSTTEVHRLLEVLDHTEYPILFHCRQGADRTGLASVILLLAHTDGDFAKARQQLGLRYGHLALGRPAYLDQFLDYYGAWLRLAGLKHSPQIFRRWAEQDYCPGGCRAALQVMDKPAHIARGEPIALQVRARNDGIKPWRLRAGNDAGIHLALDIKDEAGNPVAQARAGLFDAEVAVGQSIALSLPVPALSPGRYHFFLDMIEEQQSFFFQTGSEPLELVLEVR
ncbi:MAG TPA: tyrosine-protein phosphatase [Gemmataceae bacterium]|nr:tyrosine-protein phosphatase [Gemmataceae bacterium]